MTDEKKPVGSMFAMPPELLSELTANLDNLTGELVQRADEFKDMVDKERDRLNSVEAALTPEEIKQVMTLIQSLI